MYSVLVTISSKLNSLGLSPVVRGEAANRLNNGTAAQYVKNDEKFRISSRTSKRVWILVSRDWLGSIKDEVRLNFGLEENISQKTSVEET